MTGAGYIVRAQNNPHTILWQVSKPGLKCKSYIFGTFHQVNPSFFDTLKNTNLQFKKATLLFVEAFNGNQTGVDTAALIKSMMSWNLKKWQAVLDTVQLNVFTAYVNGCADSTLFNISPESRWVLMQYAYFQGICNIVGRKTYQAMDDHIGDIAQAKKMDIIGLDKDQVQDLKNSLQGDSYISIRNVVILCIKTMKEIISNDGVDCEFLNNYKKIQLDYSLHTKLKGLEILLDGRNKNG